MSTKTNGLQADLTVVQGDKTPFALEDWVVEPEFNRLTRGGVTHRLEPKVMQVLLRLAAQPRHVVAKDELIRAVWSNTYVTEDGLTRCISLLRNVLGDDAHHPHFIQTVSKVGYCLMVGISPLPAEEPESPPDLRLTQSVIPDRETGPEPETIMVPVADKANENESAPKPSEPSSARNVLRFSVPILALALVIGLAYWAVPAMRANQGQQSYKTFQLTTESGEQSNPEFSPDGKQLAFVWAKEDGSPQHIYIKELGHESVQRLTDLDDAEFSPIWSPDGKQIAFLSASPKGLGLYIAPLGSSPNLRKVYTPGVNTRWQDGALSWSPDGKSIAIVDHVDGAQASSSIYLIDLTTAGARMLTTPPVGWEGDLSPVFSPAGDKIAFVRASESWVRDLYWVSAGGGEPHRITHDNSLIRGIAWSADKHWVAFSSNRAGQFALWKVAIDGTNLQRLPVGTENATQPAISRTGADLAFVQSSALFDILRITNSKAGSAEPNKQRIVSSTASDSAASVSPDGTRIAFQSWRSGEQQIWVAGIEGQALRQLTPNGRLAIAGTPTWSPDGNWIAFDARQSGHSHIYIASASGGSPQQLTFGEVNDIIPRWSIDGRSVYFRSNRGGRWQIWKQSVADGKPEQLTSDDGINAQESADGKWLYFARGAESGIWRIPTTGGEPARILDQPATGYWGYWSVSRNAIYFLDQRQQASISSYNPTTGKTVLFATLDHLPRRDFSGMSALSGKQELLLSDTHNASRHIIIAKGAF